MTHNLTCSVSSSTMTHVFKWLECCFAERIWSWTSSETQSWFCWCASWWIMHHIYYAAPFKAPKLETTASGWEKCHQSRRPYFINLDHLHPSHSTEAFPAENIPTPALWCQQGRLVQQNKVFSRGWENPRPGVLQRSPWRTLPSSWLPNQSASCMERELPCPCHNKWLPRLHL